MAIDANEIINGLWIGSLDASNDLDFINTQKFDIVIRCRGAHNGNILTHNTPSYANTKTYMERPVSVQELYKKLNIQQVIIVIEDKSSENILQYLSTVVDTVDKYMTQNKKILIHCNRGISRSATLLTAYLLHRNLNLICYLDTSTAVIDTINDIKKIRSCINPNKGFRLQLEQYYNTLRLS